MYRTVRSSSVTLIFLSVGFFASTRNKLAPCPASLMVQPYHIRVLSLLANIFYNVLNLKAVQVKNSQFFFKWCYICLLCARVLHRAAPNLFGVPLLELLVPPIPHRKPLPLVAQMRIHSQARLRESIETQHGSAPPITLLTGFKRQQPKPMVPSALSPACEKG